jgi:hypothetical protein
MLQRKANKFDELRRIVDIVAKARYCASRRLLAHHWFSQITLTAVSTSLIVIPVLVLGGFNKNFAPKYVEVMQIIFAVLILGYTFLLALGNFATRGESHHRCGLALSGLLRRMKPFEGKDGHESEYNQFQREYGEILDAYENHGSADYRLVILEQKIRDGYPKRKTMKEDPAQQADETRFTFFVRFLEAVQDRWVRRFLMWGNAIVFFGHYVATVFGIGFWTYLMIRTK